MPYTREVWTLSSRVKGEITTQHFEQKVQITPTAHAHKDLSKLV